MTRCRQKGLVVDGVLILDKPQGMTSNFALQKVKRIYQARKAGHTGSLDPLATGLLPICFGEATKYSQFLLDADKTYEVTAQLGVITDSGDAEGKILEQRSVPQITDAEFAEIVQRFQGEIEQVPPMFSALKFQGKPLYELARQGITIERKKRLITIYDIQIAQRTEDTFALIVHCSKGTYIRTLIEDIGLAIGCGAHVIQLRRIASGPFNASQMITLENLQQCSELPLLPVESLLTALPKIILPEAHITQLKQGKKIQEAGVAAIAAICVYSERGEFIGVGAVDESGTLIPRRLMSTSHSDLV